MSKIYIYIKLYRDIQVHIKVLRQGLLEFIGAMRARNVRRKKSKMMWVTIKSENEICLSQGTVWQPITVRELVSWFRRVNRRVERNKGRPYRVNPELCVPVNCLVLGQPRAV